MLCYAMLCYITSHHITSHHITSHHITSHHITSHHSTSHHITSHQMMLCHIASCKITSCHIMSCHVNCTQVYVIMHQKYSGSCIGGYQVFNFNRFCREVSIIQHQSPMTAKIAWRQPELILGLTGCVSTRRPRRMMNANPISIFVTLSFPLKQLSALQSFNWFYEAIIFSLIINQLFQVILSGRRAFCTFLLLTSKPWYQLVV